MISGLIRVLHKYRLLNWAVGRAEKKPKANFRLSRLDGQDKRRAWPRFDWKSLFSGFRAEPSWPRAVGPADALIMGTVVALIAFGVVMVYSSSAVYAYQKFKDGQHFLIRQAIFAAIALPLIILFARLDYHRLRPFTRWFLIGSLALVFLTVTPLGRTFGGAARWLDLGIVSVQPSEIAKLALICWLAFSLSKKAERIKSFSIGFLPHILVTALMMALYLWQPDFGSAVIVGMLTFILLFTAGAKLRYILGSLALVSPIAYWLITASEYRKLRILAFLFPFKYRYGAGYQISESLMGYGSGGLTGVGIGDSRQKLFFLPEAHTDFIGSIIGEELGFIGLALLILAFVMLIYRGIRAAVRAPDDYGTYLAVGITLLIGMQALTNLAVSVGLLPTKGLVLPFISYGGSALLMDSVAVGILLNVSRERARAERLAKPVSANSWSGRRLRIQGGEI
ncbi:MAG: putative lipid II flippase FtsW [Deltaproteobacteria bacterium]|nr:putative lipid II flippase FtsW [Deltaproteobacteria bacterium]